MGLSKADKSKRLLRAVKTVIVLVTMLVSFLIVSAPLILVITDTLLPCAIFSLNSNISSDPTTDTNLYSHLKSYDFRYSLIDIPLISILRSMVIFCSYWCCNGPRLSRGPYLVATTLSSVVSMLFVSVKAPYVFDDSVGDGAGRNIRGMEIGLFMSSLVLAVGHIVVAYRINCRERKKLLIYKIDIEAVSACQKGFPTYHKLLHEVRVK